jgi:membrane-associated phospholipid phosphatase
MKKLPFWKKYSHAWVFLYFFIYLPWFYALEQRTGIRHHFIRCALDSYIPFNKYFIVPYFLWFGFVAATVLYFFLTDKERFTKLILFLYSGMTVFLIISTIYPSASGLRPVYVPGNNFFAYMVRFLYRIDTPTNVFPSIHVYNSLACFAAIMGCPKLRQHRNTVFFSGCLTIAIILSTMFLKQHSVIDVIGGFMMAGAFYSVIYVKEEKSLPALLRQPI